MKIAVIDLGTNTFNLLIGEVNNLNHYRILYNTKAAVQLGKGGITKRIITPEAINRGVITIGSYLQIISTYNVDKVYAYATSAVRGAINGKDFTDRIKTEFNLDINVISGEKEAELIYYGVKLGVNLTDETSVIMDIGGGSTEFIICNAYQIFWKKSFDVGAARILEAFQPSNPIKVEEIKKIEDYFNEELEELFAAIEFHQAKTLIGSSGSFDTFAEIIAHKFYEPSIVENITEYTFNIGDYHIIHEQLIRSTREERYKTKGLIPMRVDMIVIASVFTSFMLKKNQISNMRLSAYSLKEGVLNEAINGVLVEG
ncbi:MAG: Ppx/GppA family phosphatase [Bacteroidetes bacterium]|nr:Ppx/GppA family phosphatase [Bacteroidota bacterium]HET6245779.1 Ppx/GppA phosphatase family protein [Bacteroidia bacterium]